MIYRCLLRCFEHLYRSYFNYKLESSTLACIRDRNVKTPSYAVIKVNSAGEAKITNQWTATRAVAVLAGNESWRNERKNARIAGMHYFRLRCFLPELSPEHAKLEGVAFRITEVFTCRCCSPEWLFSESDVSQAIKEIALRKSTAHT